MNDRSDSICLIACISKVGPVVIEKVDLMFSNKFTSYLNLAYHGRPAGSSHQPTSFGKLGVANLHMWWGTVDVSVSAPATIACVNV